MKKILALASTIVYLLTASKAFAQTPIPPIIINTPRGGYSDLGTFVTNILTLAFGIAIILVLIMLVWGAIEWVTSGGDKEAVGKARSRIINALIGLAVLAVVFAIAKVAASFLGLDITRINIPSPR